MRFSSVVCILLTYVYEPLRNFPLTDATTATAWKPRVNSPVVSPPLKLRKNDAVQMMCINMFIIIIILDHSLVVSKFQLKLCPPIRKQRPQNLTEAS